MLVKLEGVYHVLLQSSSHSLLVEQMVLICDDPDQALPVTCSVLLDY